MELRGGEFFGETPDKKMRRAIIVSFITYQKSRPNEARASKAPILLVKGVPTSHKSFYQFLSIKRTIQHAKDGFWPITEGRYDLFQIPSNSSFDIAMYSASDISSDISASAPNSSSTCSAL